MIMTLKDVSKTGLNITANIEILLKKEKCKVRLIYWCKYKKTKDIKVQVTNIAGQSFVKVVIDTDLKNIGCKSVRF